MSTNREVPLSESEVVSEWAEALTRVREFYGERESVASQNRTDVSVQALEYGLHAVRRRLAEGCSHEQAHELLVGLLHLGFYLGYTSARSETVH